MENLRPLWAYMYSKWMAEDGDDINIVIVDARREDIESCMQARLANTQPADTTATSDALYTKEALDAAFLACYVPPAPQLE